MDIIKEAESEGYDIEYINDIDAETIAEPPCNKCDECGGDLVYIGRRNKYGNYRAFAKCDTCGEAFEF